MRNQSQKKQKHIKLLQREYGFRGSYSQLKTLEFYANDFACQMCNAPMHEQEVERKRKHINDRIEDLFDVSKLDDKFFINQDPRGYALKIEIECRPEDMIQDMGGYGLLCPHEEL